MNRSLKILIAALAVSAALNVFFVGFFAARWARRPFEPREAPNHALFDNHPSLRERWREHAAALGPRREAVRTARKAVHDALVAEPFQPETLEAALTALRSETSETQEALDRALVDFARTLNPDERRALADSRWFAPRPGRGHPN